jgi:hypothetical protein
MNIRKTQRRFLGIYGGGTDSPGFIKLLFAFSFNN